MTDDEISSVTLISSSVGRSLSPSTMSGSVSAPAHGDTALVSSTVIAEPESTSTPNNNNNVATNNNNSSGCKGPAEKKDGKLPPCSSISNNSFLWDPDVDGEMVNMPLAPQLITEVPAGEELEDLTELIGPELATLVTADSKNITIMQSFDNGSGQQQAEMNGYNNYDNIDFGKFLGEYTNGDAGQQSGGLPNQTFRKVIIARKLGGGGGGGPGPGHSGQGGPMVARTEDNNNNNSDTGTVRSEYAGGGEAGSKALLLQHRDIRSDNGGAGPSVVSSKSANGESVTLTVVRGEPQHPRGQ